MDPNANVDEQIYLATSLRKIIDSARTTGTCNGDDRANIIAKGLRLAELVEALDHWITGGGAMPVRWTRGVPGGLYVGKDR